MTDPTSAAAAFAAPVPFAGTDWPRLLMPEYGVLEDAVRQRKQAVLDLLLDRCQITGPDRFVFLRDALVPADVVPAEVSLYLQNKAGVTRALNLSLHLAGRTPEDAGAVINALPFSEAMKLALVVAGFADYIPPDKDGADPLASGGTGPQTPASSESGADSTLPA